MLWMRIIFAIALLTLTSVAVGEETQQWVPDLFAVAADSKEISSPVTNLVGRAPYFFLFDERGQLVEVIENQYLDLEFGIGPQMAAFLSDQKKVTVLVGGMVGPKMKKVLDEKDVRFVRRQGTVQDVANELKQ